MSRLGRADAGDVNSNDEGLEVGIVGWECNRAAVPVHAQLVPRIGILYETFVPGNVGTGAIEVLDCSRSARDIILALCRDNVALD